MGLGLTLGLILLASAGRDWSPFAAVGWIEPYEGTGVYPFA